MRGKREQEKEKSEAPKKNRKKKSDTHERKSYTLERKSDTYERKFKSLSTNIFFTIQSNNLNYHVYKTRCPKIIPIQR